MTKYFQKLQWPLTAVLVLGLVATSRNVEAKSELSVILRSDKAIYRSGETVRLALTVRNTGKQGVKLQFPSGQEFDITATSVGNTPAWNSKMPVWNWANDRFFTQSFTERVLAPGAVQTWKTTWKQKDNAGKLMPRGRYGLQARLLAQGRLLSPVWFITLTGSGTKPAPQPARQISIRGVVTTMHPISARPVRNFLGSISVEGKKEADTHYDRATVGITRATRFLRRSANGTTSIQFEDVREGDRVEAIFTGPVAESYPVQATASEVIILPREQNASREIKRSDAEQNRALLNRFHNELNRGKLSLLSTL